MKLPKLTTKQGEILELLYRYRFLNRIQIQALMRHKDYKTINLWLKDLREKQYVTWIYSDHFLEKTKPAIYYLNSNGIRYLKLIVWLDKDGNTTDNHVYPLEELHKRYKEHQRTQAFIDRSLLVADCCIALKAINQEDMPTETNTKSNLHYTCITEADYLDKYNDFHFLAEHETLRPNLCIVKQKGTSKTNYLLELIDPQLPQYRLRYRLKTYVKYIDERDWERETDDEHPPTILLVLPTLYSLIYAKRKVRKLLLETYYDAAEIPDDLHIRFTTTEQLQTHDITDKIWEEGRRVYGV
jgi:hypothetical protein